jgi:hypothetical protein
METRDSQVCVRCSVVLSCLAPDSSSSLSVAADQIFDAIDMDKDGKITVEEFRAAYGQMRLDSAAVKQPVEDPVDASAIASPPKFSESATQMSPMKEAREVQTSPIKASPLRQHELTPAQEDPPAAVQPRADSVSRLGDTPRERRLQASSLCAVGHSDYTLIYRMPHLSSSLLPRFW